jgi:hypothetical protein
VRYRWGKDDVAIWDNRCTLHTATYVMMYLWRGTMLMIIQKRLRYGEPPGQPYRGHWREAVLGSEEHLSPGRSCSMMRWRICCKIYALVALSCLSVCMYSVSGRFHDSAIRNQRNQCVQESTRCIVVKAVP